MLRLSSMTDLDVLNDLDDPCKTDDLDMYYKEHYTQHMDASSRRY